MKKLRNLSSEPREVMIYWDYLHQPFTDIVSITADPDSPHTLPGEDPVELVYSRWEQAAKLLLGKAWIE